MNIQNCESHKHAETGMRVKQYMSGFVQLINSVKEMTKIQVIQRHSNFTGQ